MATKKVPASENSSLVDWVGDKIKKTFGGSATPAAAGDMRVEDALRRSGVGGDGTNSKPGNNGSSVEGRTSQTDPATGISFFTNK